MWHVAAAVMNKEWSAPQQLINQSKFSELRTHEKGPFPRLTLLLHRQEQSSEFESIHILGFKSV